MYEEHSSDGMTTPNLYDEKEVMKEFISCYRHFTALWDNNSMDYLSKKKKEPGYQELLKILKRVNRDASVQDVKRKINSLRCCYRREIKKIQLSYDSYEPRLWWFHMMYFLKPVLNLDQNMMSTSTATPISKSTMTTPSSRVKQESRRSLDDSLDEASMHDEDIFAEPFQPEEDMLVIEGEAEADGEGELEVDGELEGEGEVEAEMLGEGLAESELEAEADAEAEAEAEAEAVAAHAQVTRRIKIENKYQSHSSNNNNNNSSSAGSNKYAHPYNTTTTNAAQQQQQRQQQLQLRRSAVRRQRQRSSDFDAADTDYDAGSGRGSSSNKKQRRHMMMEQRSAEHEESECDLIGKRMAAHFRNMRPDQRLFAERIISEVLVYGRMNRLSLDARFLPNGNGDALHGARCDEGGK